MAKFLEVKNIRGNKPHFININHVVQIYRSSHYWILQLTASECDCPLEICLEDDEAKKVIANLLAVVHIQL